jgi:hypothetical protein
MSLIDRMGPASAYNYAKERLEIGKEIENPMMKSEWEKIILFIEKEFEA